MDLGALLQNYDQALVAIIIKWIIDAAIQSLPAPHPVEPSPFYVWFYNFSNAVASNIRLINKESQTREIVKNKLLQTGAESPWEKRIAVNEAKQDILKIKKEHLEAEMA